MSSDPQISIVVPTYREAENLPELVGRIADHLRPTETLFEIVIVDDSSPDETVDVCHRLRYSHPVRLLRRENERGLATAVLHGLRNARGEFLVVMDADLSHPPETIYDLVAALRGGAEFAIGSRYVEGGTTSDDWGRFRRLNSGVATLFARGLTQASDPLAGFFALRRSTFERCRNLRPIGYKIGLELIVRSGCREIAEIPIGFRDRTRGGSKLTLGQQILYLRHLARLYRAKAPWAG